MKTFKKLMVSSALLSLLTTVYIVVSSSTGDSSATEGQPSAKPAGSRVAVPKIANAQKICTKEEMPIVSENGARIDAELVDDDEYADLSPEMKSLMAEIQLCLDNDDRRAMRKACKKIAKIQRERGRDAVPASVRAKAVEAIGLFLPDSLAELVGFMDDTDQEVVESVFDQLDNLLNDTTIGDRDLSGMLVAMSKVLTDEDSIDAMAMAIDCNMRNSVKVATYSQILESGTDAAAARMRESIAEMLEVEVSELPSNVKALKQQLKEWLAENPDGEDDPDFYKGVD